MKPKMTFKEWLHLSEFVHFSMGNERTILLPDEKGFATEVTFMYVDPRFELWHPKGTYRDQNDDLVEVEWKDMLKIGGTGWEGLLPFTRNKFLIYHASDPDGTIGSSQGLPRLPDGWYREAEFADAEGQVVYYDRVGIYNTPDPRLAPVHR